MKPTSTVACAAFLCLLLMSAAPALAQRSRPRGGQRQAPRPARQSPPAEPGLRADPTNELGYLLPVSRPSGKTPLILIHGFRPGGKPRENLAADNKYWADLLPRLTGKGYDLYLYQYRTNVASVERLAEVLGVLIDAKLTDRPHLILGHSMGGLVAKSYMADYTHRRGTWQGRKGGETVLGLVTLATPHHGSPLANDPRALDHLALKSYDPHRDAIYAPLVLDVINFFASAPKQSTEHNRSDLRWDNYDNVLKADANTWLLELNRRFAPYHDKTISYVGMMPSWYDPNMITLGVAAGLAVVGPRAIMAVVSGDRGELAELALLATASLVKSPPVLFLYLNSVLFFGYNGHFWFTDGAVPAISAMECGKFEAAAVIAAGGHFICESPFRVRRFEPVPLAKVKLPPVTNSTDFVGAVLKLAEQDVPTEAEGPLPGNTLSITQKITGYNHTEMKQRPEIANLVLQDLASFTRR